MVLARCLRQLISNADLDSSLLRPHCKFLLRQAKLCLDVGRGGACDAEVVPGIGRICKGLVCIAVC